MKLRILTGLAVATLFSTAAFADVTFSIGGTFASNAASGQFSAPSSVILVSIGMAGLAPIKMLRRKAQA